MSFAAALQALLFVAPVVGYLAPMAMVSLLLALCLVLVGAGWRQFNAWGGLRPILPYAGLLAIFVLSSLWSIDAGASLKLAVELIALFAAGGFAIWGVGVLPESARRRAVQALGWGSAVAGMLTLAEAFDHAALGHLLHRFDNEPRYMVAYSRGASVQAILTIPLTIGLYRAGLRRLAIIQLVVGAASIVLGYQLAAKVALATGLIAGAAMYALPRLRWAVPAGLVLLAIVPPLLVPSSIRPATACELAVRKPSALHRLYIWNFVGAAIDQRPILGWGLDAARRIPGGDGEVWLSFCPPESSGSLHRVGPMLPLHPHNAALQVWLELGGVGMAAAAGALVFSLVRAARAVRYASRFGAAMLGAYVSAACVAAEASYGIWQQWWVASLLFGCVIVEGLSRLTAMPGAKIISLTGLRLRQIPARCRTPNARH